MPERTATCWTLSDMSGNGRFIADREVDRRVLSGPTVVRLGIPLTECR